MLNLKKSTSINALGPLSHLAGEVEGAVRVEGVLELLAGHLELAPALLVGEVLHVPAHRRDLVRLVDRLRVRNAVSLNWFDQRNGGAQFSCFKRCVKTSMISPTAIAVGSQPLETGSFIVVTQVYPFFVCLTWSWKLYHLLPSSYT